jgi:hypothetical protein
LGREYAEKVGLSEDLIGRSMNWYVTPIPEFTQAVQEQIQQNMDRLFKIFILRSKEKREIIESKRSGNLWRVQAQE